ncbi:hypothetical protein PYR71_23800 [Rhizobium sp. MC63]|uniref:Uncharacterized protein n=2 Tax=Rhizobium TaxID=379 RepID=A0A7W8XF47_9HYPH|nr:MULTISPECIES: hypothetical protein [Rhizobium]MBB4574544.1 hypothetical protein [Rhizobium lentis]MBB5550471.1 hypothetical protein [Rhizobium lentis]MBB5561407.1 hypothetical protein [Rhizobium lentis]MBB5567590.1 hypothetical protein [Rhizobium lentis]MDF0699463.1 hypothetical protein [Rhizobium sp. MC63]
MLLPIGGGADPIGEIERVEFCYRRSAKMETTSEQRASWEH